MKFERTGHATGLRAETLAAWYLRAKGYRIVAKRYKTPVGEIDLIARRGRLLIFVEVKARATLAAALEATTPIMCRRITRAAEYFRMTHPEYGDFTLRFDLIAIKPPFTCRHLDNAWRPAA